MEKERDELTEEELQNATGGRQTREAKMDTRIILTPTEKPTIRRANQTPE